ncbi:MAG: molecular chaperone HtpG [Myxococcota bacterium]|nr:molecular chaperone HtpG [Myxococcota bacterium]
MPKKPKSREFHAQTQKLLDLMIHSVYSEKEVFLRELVSNASDAIDKVRFLAQTDTELAKGDHDYKIKLTPNAEEGTLEIADNGIGMSFDEAVENLGTIARSGTEAFLEELSKAGSEGVTPDLIGRFGLGFYSAFMVADRVQVDTYKHGEEKAVRWISEGDGTYTVEKIAPEGRGTRIVLTLKTPVVDAEAEEAAEEDNYAEAWKLRQIVKKHSDFVRWPIVMDVERTEYPDKEDGSGKDYEAEPKQWIEEEVLNSQTALWTREPKEIADEEYTAFYKAQTHDWSDPSSHLHFKVEGMREYTALMYLPERAPADLYTREARRGLSLYVKNVFIMEDCRELMPEYLRFIRGLVDSPDLPLNVSREMVQQDRVIASMRKMLTKKWLGHLNSMLTEDREAFEKVWTEFGAALKEGYHYDPKNQDKLNGFTLWQSTGEGDWTTLGEYVERMKEGQEEIYVLLGKDLDTLREAPQLEVFRKKGVEVLLLTDHVDEFVLQGLESFQEKKLVDISRGEVDLSGLEGESSEEEDADTEKQESYAPLCGLLQTALEDQIASVRVSKRLTDSAACLVTPQDAPSPQMERMMRAMGQEMPPVKRTLELNPDHALIQKLQALHSENSADDRLGEFGELLYAQALLSEGGQLENPARFAKKMASVMAKAI